MQCMPVLVNVLVHVRLRTNGSVCEMCCTMCMYGCCV